MSPLSGNVWNISLNKHWTHCINSYFNRVINSTTILCIDWIESRKNIDGYYYSAPTPSVCNPWIQNTRLSSHLLEKMDFVNTQIKSCHGSSATGCQIPCFFSLIVHIIVAAQMTTIRLPKSILESMTLTNNMTNMYVTVTWPTPDRKLL